MLQNSISEKQLAANRANAAREPMVLMSAELAGNSDIEITRAQNRNFLLGEGFNRITSKSNSWSLFLRYYAQVERHYRGTVEEFERLRRLRSKPSNEPISEQPTP